ncbi:MAG: hypothetical protein K9M45_11905 [Kiritimatiellales bacterium]|nr:hypothetical protein [Kiritimatiellales bacterium]
MKKRTNRMDNGNYRVPSPERVQEHGVQMNLTNGVPSLFCGEKPFFGTIYTFDPYSDRLYLDALRSMYEDGVRLFTFLMPLTTAWREDGSFDFRDLDSMHRQILEAAPEALFMPRVFLSTPSWWDRFYPDELIRFRGVRPAIQPNRHDADPWWNYEGKIYHGPDNPSLASLRWRQDAASALRAYVRHTWQKPYTGHFFGYQPAYGTCGEWGPYGSYIGSQYGSYDFSPPMLAAFRTSLGDRYSCEEELRRAWNHSDVTFDDAEPPDKLATLMTHRGVFRQPARSRQWTDWVDCYSRQLNHAILHFCAVVKKAAPVPVVTGAFAGYYLQTGCSAYISQQAKTQLDLLLENPALDILSTPNVYHNREAGVFSQAPVQTIARRKIFIIENDVLTWKSYAAASSATEAEREESLSRFTRDTLYSFTQGTGHFWYYDFGRGWYLDESCRTLIRRLEEVAGKLPPDVRSGQAEIAYVVDEASTAYSEGLSGYYMLSRDCLNTEICRIGAPCDVVTVEDLLQRPRYKLCIFRDLWYVPERRLRELRQYLDGQHVSAVWCYACGAINEKGFDAGNCRRLTQIQLEAVDTITSNQCSITVPEHHLAAAVPRTVGSLGNNDIRGIYGPVLYSTDPNAEILGQLESLHLPGIAMKEKESRFDFWTAAPLLPWQLLNNLAAHAGVHLWTKPGTWLSASGKIFALHTDQDEELSVIPPGPSDKLTDLISDESFSCSEKTVIPIPFKKNKLRLFAQKEAISTEKNPW